MSIRANENDFHGVDEGNAKVERDQVRGLNLPEGYDITGEKSDPNTAGGVVEAATEVFAPSNRPFVDGGEREKKIKPLEPKPELLNNLVSGGQRWPGEGQRRSPDEVAYVFPQVDAEEELRLWRAKEGDREWVIEVEQFLESAEAAIERYESGANPALLSRLIIEIERLSNSTATQDREKRSEIRAIDLILGVKKEDLDATIKEIGRLTEELREFKRKADHLKEQRKLVKDGYLDYEVSPEAIETEDSVVEDVRRTTSKLDWFEGERRRLEGEIRKEEARRKDVSDLMDELDDMSSRSSERWGKKQLLGKIRRSLKWELTEIADQERKREMIPELIEMRDRAQEIRMTIIDRDAKERDKQNGLERKKMYLRQRAYEAAIRPFEEEYNKLADKLVDQIVRTKPGLSQRQVVDEILERTIGSERASGLLNAYKELIAARRRANFGLPKIPYLGNLRYDDILTVSPERRDLFRRVDRIHTRLASIAH